MSNKIHVWAYIILAVLLAVAANYTSTIWAGKQSKFTPWLLAVIIISPAVFIVFGLVTSKLGLAVTSATIDSLLTLSTVLIGLFFLNEWNTVSLYQYVGMGFAFFGIILMQFHK
jgi:multidrug transporter EmrE-like cation transporter